MIQTNIQRIEGVNLVEFIRDYEQRSCRPVSYRKNLHNLADKLQTFDPDVRSDTFDYQKAEAFVQYLSNLGLKQNTIRSLCCRVNTLLKRAVEAGFPADFSIQRLTPRAEETVEPYLTTDEIDKLFEMELSEERARVRDLFLMGYWTGQRWSDYSRLSPEHIVENKFIRIRQRKTDALVEVPISTMLRVILERNDFRAPRCGSQQNFNHVIKNVCRAAEINEIVTDEYRLHGQLETHQLPKWQMIGSHTARRSFATNAWLCGQMKNYEIMLLTGHKTEQAFLQYIRITRTENARSLAERPFFE